MACRERQPTASPGYPMWGRAGSAGLRRARSTRLRDGGLDPGGRRRRGRPRRNAGPGDVWRDRGAAAGLARMVEPTDFARDRGDVPAGQKVAVIANTETACRAINGTVANQAAGGARAVN